MVGYRKFEELKNQLDAMMQGESSIVEMLELKGKILKTILIMEHDAIERILGEVMSLKNDDCLKRWVYSFLPDIYKTHPSLKDKIFHILNDDYAYQNLEVFYENATKIALLSKDEQSFGVCLDKINLRINSSQNTPRSLRMAYYFLGDLLNKDVPHKKYIIQIIKYGLENKKNDPSSIDLAVDILESKEMLKSGCFFYQRTPEDRHCPYNIEKINQVPPQKPCVFVLPGAGVTNEKALNAYFSEFDDFLVRHNVRKDVDIAGVVYHFGDFFDLSTTQNRQMFKYHRTRDRNFDNEEENINPQYVQEIFDVLLLPRIADKNGKRLDTNQAVQNIRNINFFTHCHGASVFLMLEEKLNTCMKDLQYTNGERDRIFSNLLCVSYAPFAPLGVAKSKVVSFASARDYRIKHFNQLAKYIRKMAFEDKVPLSFFEKERGNVFVVQNIMRNRDEHDYFSLDPQNKNLTEDGAVLSGFMASAVHGGVQSSLLNTPLENIQTLIAQNSDSIRTPKLLDRAVSNAQKIWKKILVKIKQDNMARKSVLKKNLYRGR